MAYGNLYYSDFYDRFSNPIAVLIQQDGYTGSQSDVTLGSHPVKIHWIGEGNDKYNPICGSTCEVSVISDTDEKFFDLFVGTARDFKVQIKRFGNIIWQGFVDPDSYREPFLYQPYESVIHANDGLGDLKNIPFPKPSSTDILTFEQPLIYYVYNALEQIGISKDIYIANNVSYNGAPNNDRPFDDVYITHQTFRDDDDNFINCYEVLEYILRALGSRIYTWNDRWYITRIDQMVDSSVDYHIYSSGAYSSTLASQDPSTALTGVSGSPLCVWVDQSQDMEIVPAWREFDIVGDCGERGTLHKTTTGYGNFSDDDFYLVSGSLKPRWWTETEGEPPSGYNNLQTIKFPGSNYWRLKGLGVPAFTNPADLDECGRVTSDAITIDGRGLSLGELTGDDAGYLKFRAEFKARVWSDDPTFWQQRPFLRFNILVKFPNTAYNGSRPNGYYYYSAGSGDIDIGFFEDSGKLKDTTTLDWYHATEYKAPGASLCQFKDSSDHTFSVETEPMVVVGAANIQPQVRLVIYPVFSNPASVLSQAIIGNQYHLDLYSARLKMVMIDDLQQTVGYTTEETVSVDSNNRHKPSTYTYKFGNPSTYYNEKYYHKYIFLDDSGSDSIWWKIGSDYLLKSANDIVSSTLKPVMKTASLRPKRKLSGELLTDDVNFGTVLVDHNSKRYICTGVEYDAKFSRWNGEWIQLHDYTQVDAGDFDADDFDSSDFYAI